MKNVFFCVLCGTSAPSAFGIRFCTSSRRLLSRLQIRLDDVVPAAEIVERIHAAFPLEPFARYCLLNGQDELAFLLSHDSEIMAFEKAAGPAPWRTA